MDPKKCARRRLWWLGAFALALVGRGAEPNEAALQHPGAIVAADVTGDVTARYGDQRKAVKAEDRLRVDALVTTGRRSAVTLQLSNGAVVQLGAESELEFEDFGQVVHYDTTKPAELKAEPSISRTRIRLARGDVSLDVKPLQVGKGSSFMLDLVAGALQISQGKCRALVQMSDLGLGVCTVEMQEGDARFEVQGGKPVPLPPGRRLTFAIEIEKSTGTVKVGDMPKPADAKPAPAGK